MFETSDNLNSIRTFIALPVDSFDSNIFSKPEHYQIIKNAIIETLPDGTVHIVDTNNDNEISEPQTQNVLQNEIIPLEKNCAHDNTPEDTNDSRIQHKSNSVYKCSKCKEVFNKVGLYHKHMLWHQSKKFKCTTCSAGYNVETNLILHMAMHGEGKPTCPICKISFQRLASLKSHLMLHQVEELYTCDECASEFEKEDELIKHFQSHMVNNRENNLICPYCSVQFDARKAYKEHISHHIKVKKMVLSGKKPRRVRTNKEYSHKCSICLKSFSRISLLERHLRVHSGERPFVCPHCSRSFNQKGTLQIHLSKHTGIKPFHCTLCSAKFNQKGNLRVHVEKTHTASIPGVKMYKCPHCTCIFKKIASLNVHITKTHATVEDMGNISDVMSRLKKLEEQTTITFNTKATDKKIVEQNKVILSEIKKGNDTANMSHVKLAESFLDGTVRQYLVTQKKVNDVRWYVCNFCNKEFKKPSDLIRHTRVHTREKPFVCKQCGASFSLKSTLFCHAKTHSSNNGYLCNICMKKFSSMRSLNAHLRRHLQNENQEYKYDICNKNINSLQQTKQHNDKVHNSSQIFVKESVLDASRKLKLATSSKLPLEQCEQNIKQFRCQSCNLRFTKMTNLNRHIIRIHSEEKKFKCDRCFKSYRTDYALKIHLLSHSGVKNYNCKICGKNYMTASLLKRHAVTHNIHKHYLCSCCNKNFRSATLCKNHMNIHTRQLSNLQIDTILNESEKMQNISGANSIDLLQKSEISSLEETQEFEENIYSNVHETEKADFIVEDPSSNCEIQYKTVQVFDSLTSHPPLQLLTNVNKHMEQDSLSVHTNFGNFNDAQLASNVNSEISDPVLFNSINNIHEGNALNVESLSENIRIQNTEIYISNEVFNVNQTNFDEKTNTKNEANLTNKICKLNNSNFVHYKPKQDKTNTVDHDVPFYSELNLFNIESEIETNNCDLPSGKLNLTDISEGQQSNSETFQQNISLIKNSEERRKKFIYDRCKKVYLNCNQYSKHTDAHTNVRKKGIKLHHCDFCSKDFGKHSDLIRHIRTHTGEKPFACDKCDKSFSLKSTLVSHQRTHNPISHKHYNCIVCNSFFTSKSSLKVHMSVHTGDKTHECRFCSLKFRTAAHRKSHEINNHTNPSKKKKNKITNLLASVAMDAINNQTLINLQSDHSVTNEDLENVLVVQEQLPFNDQLNFLNESSTNALSESNQLESIILQQFHPSSLLTDNFVSPSMIHLTDATVLNVKSTQIEQLNEKGSGTSSEKPRKFECDICSKKYTSKDVLRRHKKIHGVNKKFPCTKCDKGFNLKGELEEHDRTHVGFRPYSCMYCSNSFAKEHSLTVHIKRIHNASVKVDNLVSTR